MVIIDPHFSRADIACDIIDVPDEFITQYRIVDPVSFKPIFGRSGKLETVYCPTKIIGRLLAVI